MTFFIYVLTTMVSTTYGANKVQKSIFYPERKHDLESSFKAKEEGYHYKEERLASTGLKMWLFPSKKHGSQQSLFGNGILMIAIYHGNGDNRSSNWTITKTLIDEGYDVATFDYRGFFDSPERNQQFPISPATTQRDSIDFCRYLQNNYRGSTLVLFGISLGSINSLLAAAQSVKDNKKVKGVILDSGFSSYVGLGREHIRRFFLPFQFVADILLDDAFAPTNSDCLSLDGIPRLFVHATGDPRGCMVYDSVHLSLRPMQTQVHTR